MKYTKRDEEGCYRCEECGHVGRPATVYRIKTPIWRQDFSVDNIICLPCAVEIRGKPYDLDDFVWCPGSVDAFIEWSEDPSVWAEVIRRATDYVSKHSHPVETLAFLVRVLYHHDFPIIEEL